MDRALHDKYERLRQERIQELQENLRIMKLEYDRLFGPVRGVGTAHVDAAIPLGHH